jgi:hypothetical protein
MKGHLFFFECHINDIHEKSFGVSAIDFLNNLEKIGYSEISIWDGSGDFLAQINLSEKDFIKDIFEYYRNRWGLMYMDICVTHESDFDISQNIRETESIFFKELRNTNTSTL